MILTNELYIVPMALQALAMACLSPALFATSTYSSKFLMADSVSPFLQECYIFLQRLGWSIFLTFHSTWLELHMHFQHLHCLYGTCTVPNISCGTVNDTGER